MTTLALGLLAFMVAYAVVAFWARADRQITHSDRTFAISSRIVLADRSSALRLTTITNHFVAEYLQTDFPQIEAVARARTLGGDVPVSAGNRTARVYAASVDPPFLSIFDLPFLEGNARTAFSRPGSVVLTEDAAARLFGAADPLGKTVSFANRVDATVTGVIAPIPEPSLMGRSFGAQLPFDVLTSMDVFERYTSARSGYSPPPWASR